MANTHGEGPARAKNTAEAFSDLDAAVTDLKLAIADTAAWRMLVRFVDRHPLVSLFAFPALLLGLSGYSLVIDRPVEAIFYAVVALAAPWILRR